jgi:hypothetical protein
MASIAGGARSTADSRPRLQSPLPMEGCPGTTGAGGPPKSVRPGRSRSAASLPAVDRRARHHRGHGRPAGPGPGEGGPRRATFELTAQFIPRRAGRSMSARPLGSPSFPARLWSASSSGKSGPASQVTGPCPSPVRDEPPIMFIMLSYTGIRGEVRRLGGRRPLLRHGATEGAPGPRDVSGVEESRLASTRPRSAYRPSVSRARRHARSDVGRQVAQGGLWPTRRVVVVPRAVHSAT